MLKPTPGVVIHLHREPVDMRKSLNGLVTIVEGQIELDSLGAFSKILTARANDIAVFVSN